MFCNSSNKLQIPLFPSLIFPFNHLLLPGYPLQRVSIGVAIFVSIILSYFSFFVFPCNPCQGNFPFKKYINTYPIASKSSRRLGSKHFYKRSSSLKFPPTDAKMSIYAGISCSSCEIFIVSERNMDSSSWVSVFFGKAVIDNIDLVGSFSKANEEIIRFDISVNKVLGMHILDSCDLFKEEIRKKKE